MKETKELVDFVVGLAMAVDKSASDGKLDFDDAAHLMGLVRLAGPAFSGLDLAALELKAMTPEKLDALMQAAKADLRLAHVKVEAVVEAALDVAQKLYVLVDLLKPAKA